MRKYRIEPKPGSGPKGTAFARFAATAATLLALAATGPTAFADSPDSAAVDAIQAVAPDALHDAETSLPGSVAAHVGGAPLSVSIPRDATAGLTIRAGRTVTIGLPFAHDAHAASGSRDGLTSFDNRNGSSTVPVVHESGDVQLLTVISNQEAPSTYDYPIGLPSGARLVADGSGAKAVDADGTTLGVFRAPWAKDADGRPVPTRYVVRGPSLIQVVEHRSANFRYPVVADPIYTLYTFYYSRTDVETLWKAINNINNVCRYLPLSYLASLGCGAPPNLADAVTQAHYQQKRIKAVYHDCGFNYCSYYTYYVVT